MSTNCSSAPSGLILDDRHAVIVRHQVSSQMVVKGVSDKCSSIHDDFVAV